MEYLLFELENSNSTRIIKIQPTTLDGKINVANEIINAEAATKTIHKLLNKQLTLVKDELNSHLNLQPNKIP